MRLELERGLPLVGAGRQLDEGVQELTAGCSCQMHYQFFSDPWQKVKISPHRTVDGLERILSVQVEAWLILSERQLALACLLKFAQTYVPTQDTQEK